VELTNLEVVSIETPRSLGATHGGENHVSSEAGARPEFSESAGCPRDDCQESTETPVRIGIGAPDDVSVQREEIAFECRFIGLVPSRLGPPEQCRRS